ncbi:hypothetical protein [Desulfosporosinus sp. BICA1-9]|uniref:hypothetical protein n=1 Tax=Desulfosporosinus sp. BICA1-9 TaxID=1531958 RepID=UPI000B28FDB8|nr:hypothetical protein [Desulfosporosinus sp. BICA1-9]
MNKCQPSRMQTLTQSWAVLPGKLNGGEGRRRQEYLEQGGTRARMGLYLDAEYAHQAV